MTDAGPTRLEETSFLICSAFFGPIRNLSEQASASPHRFPLRARASKFGELLVPDLGIENVKVSSASR
jgi:hypothetical protein